MVRMSPFPRLALACIAVAVSGCPGGFVDPNPPKLERVVWAYTAEAEDRPLVYAIVFDLHLADPSRCPQVKATIRGHLRSLLADAVTGAVEAPETDVTGGTCVQTVWRTVDPYAVQNGAISAAGRFPQGTVRPVFIYVNNVDGIPQNLFYQLKMLRNPASAFAAAPLLWGIVLPKVKAAISFERSAAWTYAEDPALVAPLLEAAGKDLPLQGTAAATVELFTVQDVQGYTWLKSCTALPTGSFAVNFRADGSASRIQLGAVPAIGFTTSTPPTPKGDFKPPEYTFTVEVCTAHCERYLRYAGHYRSWLDARGCHETSRVAP